jgi:hypothetical protein
MARFMPAEHTGTSAASRRKTAAGAQAETLPFSLTVVNFP